MQNVLQKRVAEQDVYFSTKLMSLLNHVLVLLNTALRRYLIKWTKDKEPERWVFCHLDKATMHGIHTNNGVESNNNVIKRGVMGGKAGCH